jgi:hypothetical protein
MGDPAALADFLAWGTANYPAQHIALVLWDHGGGCSGLDWDESSPGEDHLALSELASTLQTAGASLDIVGFDACLMGRMDVLAALAPYAGLVVASEEVIPATGWDYRTWLGHLYVQPAMPPRDLAGIMVSDYLASYSGPNPEPTVTLAAVDMAGWGEVRTAVDSLAGVLSADLAAALPAIGDSRAAVETYATAYPDEVEQYAAQRQRPGRHSGRGARRAGRRGAGRSQGCRQGVGRVQPLAGRHAPFSGCCSNAQPPGVVARTTQRAGNGCVAPFGLGLHQSGDRRRVVFVGRHGQELRQLGHRQAPGQRPYPGSHLRPQARPRIPVRIFLSPW